MCQNVTLIMLAKRHEIGERAAVNIPFYVKKPSSTFLFAANCRLVNGLLHCHRRPFRMRKAVNNTSKRRQNATF